MKLQYSYYHQNVYKHVSKPVSSRKQLQLTWTRLIISQGLSLVRTWAKSGRGTPDTSYYGSLYCRYLTFRAEHIAGMEEKRGEKGIGRASLFL